MAKLFTWKILNKGADISCVANDIEEARCKILETIHHIVNTSDTIEAINEMRRELIKEFHSTSDDSVVSKELLRNKIVDLDEQIINLRNGIKANISIGLKPLSYFTCESSFIQMVSITEPTVTEFFPVTLRRDE
jgi:hypothetical protein